MTRHTLWIHPFNGIAGDMMLGALIDAGADADQIRKQLERLSVDGWTLNAEPIFRNGIGAMNVTVDADEGHVHRTAADIIAVVEASGLTDRVVERATAVFRALADAEGQVHRADPETVHFHEVGGIDAIVDVVGSCLALDLLDIEHIVVAPLAQGHGIAKSAHGIISNPAPATAKLLEGVPTKGLDVRVELTTPTGAALVRALADEFGPMPAMTVSASGFGAGDLELDDHPNLLQVVVGDSEVLDTRPLIVLEANVDDLSGEYLAHAVTRLVDEGALDAWLTPIEMKKGRPAATVSALVEPTSLDHLRTVLLEETGSIGCRSYGVDRHAAPRVVETVIVDGQEIRLKQTAHTVKAEYSDVARAAATLDRPARAIAREAENLATPAKFVR